MAIKVAGVDVINDDRELVLAKLTEINETINDTAVDVFVYDTSKDSDGGAWRHRTQHTSWYNEASSSTRGSRAEFPAVAVIVAESNKVTIYDGDDPSLPMWIVFNNSGLLAYTSTVSSVAMLNGLMSLGAANGFSEVNFLSEELRFRQTGNDRSQSSISTRNTTALVINGLAKYIVNNTVNDVAMTVLPDAPTDPATGLPVPTIAVATDGGVSVITDSGAVYDTTVGFTPVGSVSFDADGNLFNRRDSGNDWCAFSTVADYTSGDGFGDLFAAMTVGNQAVDMLGGIGDMIGSFGDVFVEAGLRGVGLHKLNTTAFSQSLSAKTTSDYTTGWMPGDIKLAALADTTAETFGDAVSGATVSDPNGDGVYDGEHVTNGDFATDTDWTKGSGWTISGGVASFSGGGLSGDDLIVYQDGNVITTGSIYEVTYTVSGRTSGTVAVFLRGSSPAVYHSTNETFTRYLVAGSSSRDIEILANDSFDGSIDNISVRLADPDRSVNGNGLAVHGSITKAAVATGADVVGYSGFSASNYLEQPYNSDLDFGTGDFCVMGWAKPTSTGSQVIIDRGNADGVTDTNRFVLLHLSGSGWQFFIKGSSGTQNLTVGSNATTNVWQHVCGVRTGGSLYLYVNGELANSGASTAQDVSNSSSSLQVGLAFNDTAPFNSGSLALWRISATAPTADQIAKIYNDEKFLFQENAKATLTGTSDAVTALAHDPDADLLHVGTSGGRSVFQGLRRVDETATAVTTAISAVDGLVVEQ